MINRETQGKPAEEARIWGVNRKGEMEVRGNSIPGWGKRNTGVFLLEECKEDLRKKTQVKKTSILFGIRVTQLQLLLIILTF